MADKSVLSIAHRSTNQCGRDACKALDRGMLRNLIRLTRTRLVKWIWRRRGVRFAGRVEFYGRLPSVSLDGPLRLGKDCTFRGGRTTTYLEVRYGGMIVIGSRTFINGGVEIQSARSVKIGDGCLIGDEVVIQDTAFHEVDEGQHPKVAPVVVGNNVWIARRAIILPGVTIGDHAVVGACAIVTRDVAPRTVVAGNPARVIRNVEARDDFRR